MYLNVQREKPGSHLRPELPLNKVSQCLFVNADHLTGTYGTSTFTDGETQTNVDGHRVDKLNGDLHIITGHYHLSSLGKLDLTSNIQGPQVKLGTVVVVDRECDVRLLPSSAHRPEL